MAKIVMIVVREIVSAPPVGDVTRFVDIFIDTTPGYRQTSLIRRNGYIESEEFRLRSLSDIST